MTAPPSPRAAVVISMIDALPGRDRQQISQALHAQLNPGPSAVEQRVRELLPLAAMLDEQGQQDGIALPVTRGRATWRPTEAGEAKSIAVERFPVVEQLLYDQRRPAGAPSGEQLARRFGTWVLACRAVWGLQADGRYSGLGRPWATGTRGKKRTARYTRAEALAAIRKCALAYGRRPTSNLYITWSAGRRAHARACASPPPRLPAYKHYHETYGGWPQALALAAISDSELAQARADRSEPGPDIPEDRTPAGRLRAADVERLAAAGVRPRDVTQMLKRGFGEIDLVRGVVLARVLGGSVAWLAGADPDPGDIPDTDLVLDVAAVRQRRGECKLPEQAIRDHIGLTANDWRRLLDRRDQPRLRELIELAGLLGVRPDYLLTPAS